MEARERKVLSYKSPDGRFPYREWRASLNDEDAEVAVDVRITPLSVAISPGSRTIGGGVFESRIDFGRRDFHLHVSQGAEPMVRQPAGSQRGASDRGGTPDTI